MLPDGLNMSGYFENIELAENILSNLSPVFYPNLYRVFYRERGHLENKLRVLLEYIKDHWVLTPDQTGGEYYTSVSIRQLTAKGGGSAGTWGGLLAQLSGWGLIRKAIPTYGTPAGNRARQERYKQRKQRGLRADQEYPLIMWYHVPAWTAEVLQRAEELAEYYIPAGTCTRATARDVYGEELAKLMYPDGRQGIGKITQRIRDGIDRAVQDRISRKGYFYRDEIPSDVRQQRIKHKGQEIRKDQIRRVYNGYLTEIVNKYRLRHGKPTAEELSRYRIPAERKHTWIYRPAEDQKRSK